MGVENQQFSSPFTSISLLMHFPFCCFSKASSHLNTLTYERSHVLMVRTSYLEQGRDRFKSHQSVRSLKCTSFTSSRLNTLWRTEKEYLSHECYVTAQQIIHWVWEKEESHSQVFSSRKGLYSWDHFSTLSNDCLALRCEPGTKVLRLSSPGPTPELQAGEELSKHLVSPDVSWVSSSWVSGT